MTTTPETLDTKSLEDGRGHNPESVVVDQTKQKQSWLGWLWDTRDLGREERHLLFKLDAILLTFASLGYFIKNLDQTNATSAFVSGMKEELGMYQEQLVTSTSIWTAGYVIGQLPIALLITRVSPRYVIPALELVWGFATLATYSIKSYQGLYVCRFFVGLAESAFYPAMIYNLGSFYTPRELTKRTTLFWASGSMGQMFSGYLQAAAYKNLSGVNGLSGWRWLYIIDAIITIPIALFGFIFIPALPWEAKPNWILSAREIEIARNRMQRVGRKGAAPWTKARVRKLFSSWHVYVLPLCYVLWNNSFAQNPMSYWLKSFNPTATHPAPVPGTTFTVSQINTYPTITNAIFIVCALIWAWICDGPLKGKKWPGIFAGVVVSLPVYIALLVLPVYTNIKGHYALYFLLNAGGFAGPAILGWINEICNDDNEKRALLIAAANDFAYVVQACLPLAVWKTTDFPAARKGFAYSTALQVILVFWTLLILFLLKRDKKRGVNQPDEEFISQATIIETEEKIEKKA